MSKNHPLIIRQYAIYTPPIARMTETIGDWVGERITGGHVYGPSRFGKSKAVQWHLKDILKDRFQYKIPLVIWLRRNTVVSEREFWNDLLLASGFQFCNAEKPKAKVVARFLLEQQLITLSKSSRNNYVILLIDEAQEITLNELKWLLGLQNSLDQQGILFSVISIGSYALQYKPDYLARTGNAHIAARFYSFDAQFNGIKSVEELGFVLNGYDEDTKWPPKKGVSYTRHFARDAFDHGMRLKNCTQDIWRAFEKLLPHEANIKKNFKLELPMQHIAHSIENALIRVNSGEDWDAVTDYKSWLKIISQTGFTKYYQTIL